MTDRIRLDDLTSDQYDQLHAELADAWQKFATVCGQRDRLRLRMNALADRWETALPGQPHHGFAEALRAEISIEPLPATPAEAAIDRVRAAADQLRRAVLNIDGEPLSLYDRGVDTAVRRVRAALDEPTPVAGPAAAEPAAPRVTALYERWVKAGPPPLGTPTSRWWDKRLAELGAALGPEQPGPG